MDVEKIARKVITLGTLGDSKVGKTQLTEVYIENKFNIEHITTIGYNVLSKKVNIKINNKEKELKIKIWDTTGQERFRSISTQYIKNCLGILLVYAVNNKESFNNIISWMNEIEEKKCNENVPIVLVGNKIDLKDEREVSYEEGDNFAKKFNLKFFECSAKEGINVNEAFQYLINSVVEIYKDEFILNDKDNKKILLDDNSKKKEKSGCCSKKKKNDEEEK